MRGRVADSAALRGGVAVGRDAEDVDEAQVFRDRLTVQHPSHWWLQGKGDAVFCAGCECVVRAGAPVPASLYQQPCNPYRKRNYPNYDEQQREDQAAAVRRLGPEIAARLAQEAAIRYAEEAAREDLRRKQEQDPQRREEAALRMAALRAQFETPEDEEEAEAVEEEEQDEEEAAAQRLADYWGIKH